MAMGEEKQSPEGRREEDKDPHYMTCFIKCQGGRQNLELKASCYLHRTALFSGLGRPLLHLHLICNRVQL